MDIRNEQMKQVVWLEQANSTFFESVCFVLRNDVECAGGNEMLAEAEKIEIILPYEALSKFFPKSYTPHQMERMIYKLLGDWQKKKQRQHGERCT